VSQNEIVILAGVGGLAAGLAIGYVLTARACKDQVIGGVKGAVASLGGSPTTQQLAGNLVSQLLGAGP
jgi:hypothetical protein